MKFSSFCLVSLAPQSVASFFDWFKGPAGPAGPAGLGATISVFSSGDSPTTLESLSSAANGDDAVDSVSEIFLFDIGTVSGNGGLNPTTVVAQPSITTQVILTQDEFDDSIGTGALGAMYLELLLFEGCTDATSCASVNPTVMNPGPLALFGMSKEVEIGDNDDYTFQTAISGTDTATFFLVEWRSGDFFIQGCYVLQTEAEATNNGVVAGELITPVGGNGGLRNRRKNRRKLTEIIGSITVVEWVTLIFS